MSWSSGEYDDPPWQGQLGGGPPSNGVGYGGNQKLDGEKLKAGLKQACKKEQQSDRDALCFLQNIIPKSNKRGSSSAPSFDRARLVQVLQEVFHNQIMTDWSRRNTIYCQALHVCEYLAVNQDDDLAHLLNTPVDNSESSIEIQESRDCTICTCLKEFSDLAAMVVSMAQKTKTLAAATASSVVDVADVRLAENVLRVYQLVQSRVDDSNIKMKKDAAILSVTTPVDSYRSHLGPLRFGLIQNFTQQHYALIYKTQGFHFPANNGSNLSISPQLARNLFKELTSYKSVLPVEYGSSIFVRALEDRLDLCRVLIMGPDDTPYANGCYIFDVHLTATYPSEPPKVQFINHGHKRFNPNLYQDGKVCLSLLGTWTGPGWVAGTSTLLQVLISIQSLILVPDPYFNEPGYEREMRTEGGRKHSEKYNESIRSYTLAISMEPFLKAIIDKKPSLYPEFDDVIKLHFTLKRAVITNQLRKWAQANPSLQSTAHRLLGYLDRLAPSDTTGANPKKRSFPTPVEYHVNDDGVIEIDDDRKIASRPKEHRVSDLVCLDDDGKGDTGLPVFVDLT